MRGDSVLLERSELSVPGSNRRMIEKAVASDADVVMVDLEDSVPPAGKVEARGTVIWAMRDLDWGGKPRAYRINALDTPWFYRDVVEIVEQAGEHVDLIVVPKVGSAGDLAALDRLLHGIELNRGIEPGRIGLEAQIETASGLARVEEIAGATERLETLIFGPGDFAASMGMPLRSIGARDEWDERYGGDRFHYARARMVVAARAAGLRAIDGPLADFRDLDELRSSCYAARALGYDGKWCIHPGQLEIVNEIFSPSADEVQWAQRVVAAYREATVEGRGAIVVDDRMIDLASVRMAETALAAARKLAQVAGGVGADAAEGA